jgi:hypothetical protein
MSKFNVITPHAAVVIWNYNDRIGLTTDDPLGIDKVIISTLSCLSIETNKSKSNPQGSFRMVLAPTKNWVASITPGSWCVMLMSNDTITKTDLERANPSKVKMLGKIDSVKVETTTGENGERKSLYYVTGVDWGYIFNNTIYIDQHITAKDEPQTLGQGSAVALFKMLFDGTGVARTLDTASNLRSLINVFGKSISGFTAQGTDINRLAASAYSFTLPSQVNKYFNFIDPKGKRAAGNKINDILTLFNGSLNGVDQYDGYSESVGIIDPSSIQGTHTFWQVLLDNSNTAINEMLTDLKWEKNGCRLALYSRIRPFAFKGFTGQAGQAKTLQSYYQLLPTTTIPSDYVLNLSAGTNWKDKYNFVEVKSTAQELQSVQVIYKTQTQKSDPQAFEREGFRPLIVETKQFPRNSQENTTIRYEGFGEWSDLLKQWYFDTHRMLNGSVTFVGQNKYISVGSNIKFEAKLVNPTANLTSATLGSKSAFILAHVENVAHSFSVDNNGARKYMTTVQFVRGIVVNSANIQIGQGTIDVFASSLSVSDVKNTTNTFATSDSQDPDEERVKGT